MRDTWLIIGGSIVAAIILLSLVALLACRLVNRRKSSAASRILHSEKMNIDGKRVSHQKDISKGKDNIAYLHEEKDKKVKIILLNSFILNRAIDQNFIYYNYF